MCVQALGCSVSLSPFPPGNSLPALSSLLETLSAIIIVSLLLLFVALKGDQLEIFFLSQVFVVILEIKVL